MSEHHVTAVVASNALIASVAARSSLPVTGVRNSADFNSALSTTNGINEAIDDLPSGGGMVISPGVNPITTKIIVSKSNVILTGLGCSTIINTTGLDDDFIYFSDKDNISVVNMRIVGTNQTSGHGINAAGNCSNCYHEGVKFEGIYGTITSGNIKRAGKSDSIIVAASDSQYPERADYICDGVDDQVEINAAIAELPAGGRKVVFLAGNYYIDELTGPIVDRALNYYYGIGIDHIADKCSIRLEGEVSHTYDHTNAYRPEGGTIFHITAAGYAAAIAAGGFPCGIYALAGETFPGRVVRIKNIAVMLPHQSNTAAAIDLYNVSGYEFECVYCGIDKVTADLIVPGVQLTGILTMPGSRLSIARLTECTVNGYLIGFNINSEHTYLEHCYATHCVYPFWISGGHHPITLIRCGHESCVNGVALMGNQSQLVDIIGYEYERRTVGIWAHALDAQESTPGLHTGILTYRVSMPDGGDITDQPFFIAGHGEKYLKIPSHLSKPHREAKYCKFVDEDFTGHSLDTPSKWRLQNTGDRGSHQLKDDNANGVLELVTGNQVADEMILDMNDVRVIDPTLAPVMTVGFKMDSVADDDFELVIGFVDVEGTDHAVFKVDKSVHGALNIFAEIYKAGAQTHLADTGINIDAAYHFFEIFHEVSNHKTYFIIDRITEVVSDANDLGEAEFFQPYIRINSETAVAHTVDVDFLKGFQRRA